MRILVVGDSYMPPRYFQHRLHRARAGPRHRVPPDRRRSRRRARVAVAGEAEEYQGSPSEVAERMSDVEVLVVQAAPISEEVLRAAPHLKLVGCARGGPVNVDVDALTARELPLVNTPGKNAEAVADQTIAFLVMLARGFPKAQRFLLEGNQLKDNWEGAKFIGNDLRRHTLGLVGYGRVGQRVASRARAFGMAVIVYDPYLSKAPEEAERVGAIDELLARADFVSLHARATAETANMIDAAAIAKMQPGSFLVNTARESLVDEDALDAALESRASRRRCSRRGSFQHPSRNPSPPSPRERGDDAPHRRRHTRDTASGGRDDRGRDCPFRGRRAARQRRQPIDDRQVTEQLDISWARA